MLRVTSMLSDQSIPVQSMPFQTTPFHSGPCHPKPTYTRPTYICSGSKSVKGLEPLKQTQSSPNQVRPYHSSPAHPTLCQSTPPYTSGCLDRQTSNTQYNKLNPGQTSLVQSRPFQAIPSHYNWVLMGQTVDTQYNTPVQTIPGQTCSIQSTPTHIYLGSKSVKGLEPLKQSQSNPCHTRLHYSKPHHTKLNN